MTIADLLKNFGEYTDEERSEFVAAAIRVDGVVTAILKATENGGDGRLFTQKQINEKIIPGRLKGKDEELAKASKAIEALKKASGEAEVELKELREGKASAGEDSLKALHALRTEATAKIAAFERQIVELTTEAETAKAAHTGAILERDLRDVLLANGASPTSVKHASMGARSEIPGLQIVSDNGVSRLAVLDGTLGSEKDLAVTVKDWLGKNLHFMAPKSPGSGAPSSPPGAGDGTTGDIFKGLPPGEEQLAAAVKAGFSLPRE